MKLAKMVLAATLALTSFTCQSAEQRQAHELREALLELVDEIEQLQVLDQERLAELGQQVEEYTDLELPALAKVVRTIKSLAEQKRKSAKSEIAKLQIAMFENALALFRFDVGRYPTTSEGLNSLIESSGGLPWSGPYLDKADLPQDPWGHNYQYRAPGSNGNYDLWSWGADGVKGGKADRADVYGRSR